MRISRVLSTRIALQRALATITLVGALSTVGLVPASAAAHPLVSTSADASVRGGATAVKPKSAAAPAGVSVGKTVVPKPHVGTGNSTRTARPMSPLTPWSVTLSASPSSNLWVTQYSTITATASADVGPTPYYILIFRNIDGNGPTLIASCGSGSTCSVAETGDFFDETFGAYVAPYSTTAPPAGAQATSNDVVLSWQSVGAVSLNAAPSTLPVGSTTTLTTTTDVSLTTSPFYLQLWDTSASPPTLLAQCGIGSSCSANVSQTAATTRSYVATVADFANAYPPPSVQSTSATGYITWNNAGWSISLSDSFSTPTVTATASANVGPTPYYIYIYDESTGTLLQTCGSGTTCTTTMNTPGTNLVAFIAAGFTGAPPASTVASSNALTTIYEPIS